MTCTKSNAKVRIGYYLTWKFYINIGSSIVYMDSPTDLAGSQRGADPLGSEGVGFGLNASTG
jgi:hypothetical protein